MLRLIKYLKPYTLLILLSIALLFVQATADLALPDYMANIVNIGIQQNGVENAVPQAIRQTTLDRASIFMTTDEKNRILSDYTLISKDSPDYQTYLESYPLLSEEPVYVLKKIDQAEIDWINPIMGRSLVIVSGIEQVLADPSKVPSSGLDMGFDLSKIPPGMDVFTLLKQLPEAQISKLSDAFTQQFSALGENMIVQVAAAPIKAEYQALGIDTTRMTVNYVVKAGGWMLLLTLLSGICTITVGFLAAKTAAGFARDVRHKVFTKVESFSSTEFDKFSTASLITRSTNDVTQIQMVVIMFIRMVFYAPIIGVGGIIRAVDKSANMWWIIALAVVVLLGLILTVFVIALPKFKRIQSLIDRLNLVLRENLTGMMVIRAFNMQDFEEDRFDKANIDLTKTNLFIARVMVIMMPLMMMVMNLVVVLIIWVGAHQIADSSMQVGDMMAFMQYAMLIVMAFLMLAMMFIFLPRAAVSGDRIADVLETDLIITDPQEPKSFQEPFKGVVEFRNVSFRYPGAEEDVLHDITFTAKPGQTTALIGTTGSGKSTVINLIPRFYDATKGEVIIDGINVREVRQSDLRDKIGYIPQKGLLFSGTIESNLHYGDETASYEDLKEAADISQATEFISTMPDGMNTEVSQGGVNVSGGQKQRLSIARALVTRSPIYIFDDSFSALDFKTDAALRRALKSKTGGSTMFIVSQRIATIKQAEQIIVLDEGKIIGKGTHGELMKDCEVYRSIALSQLSLEELS
ncbi:MAG TPA: ABC transporter ATP-binding protein [Anaerolineales bacterium]|nr:ABC transporter ATP-binding protein [Anaerolineales bacterium]